MGETQYQNNNRENSKGDAHNLRYSQVTRVKWVKKTQQGTPQCSFDFHSDQNFISDHKA